MVFQNDILAGSSAQVSSLYDINFSARFNDDDSPYLQDPNSNAGDSRKKFTFSGWLKLSNIGINRYVYAYRYDANNDNQFYFNTSNQIELFDKTGGSTQMQLKTNRVFTDVSSWFHVLIIWDTTQSTASDRTQLYINGQRETSFATETYPSLNADSGGANRTGANMRIGTYSASGSYFDGYMAELHFFDDESLSPSFFGRTSGGVWVAKEYEGADSTYGSNGFYFQFANSGSLGVNTKGKGNYSASGLASHDQMADTPTNNHAVMDINDSHSTPNWTVSNGNLDVRWQGNNFPNPLFSTLSIPATGKWYFEIEFDTDGSGNVLTNQNMRVGLMREDINASYVEANASTDLTTSSTSPQILVVLGNSGNANQLKGMGSTINNVTGTMSAGDRINFARNGANLWIGKNGTYYNSGNPATGSNPTLSNLQLQGYRANMHWSTGNASVNCIVKVYFGADKSIGSGTGFNDTVPTDFLALNATNLGS